MQTLLLPCEGREVVYDRPRLHNNRSEPQYFKENISLYLVWEHPFDYKYNASRYITLLFISSSSRM